MLMYVAKRIQAARESYEEEIDALDQGKMAIFAGAFILIQMSQAVQNVFLIFIIGKSRTIFLLLYSDGSMKVLVMVTKERELDDSQPMEICSLHSISSSFRMMLARLRLERALNLDFHCAFNKFHTYFSLFLESAEQKKETSLS